MSDLTRLNPTPQAIAVYASQPLSPVATQHSLPSRTLPFTWAGLSPAGSHQLCLAHSFDHLVGDGEHAGRNYQAERLRHFEVDAELELDRLLDRKIGSLGPLQYPVDVARGAPNDIGIAYVVGHQVSEVDNERRIAVHRQQVVVGRELGQPGA